MFAKIFERFHITPAIAWSIGGTLLSGLTGPVVALLIAQKFSAEMQGYYYTFSSLLAMSVFLELGFNTCIVQFISHEYAHLGMDGGKIKNNSPRVLGRLASLTRLSLKWYLVAAILLFIGVGLGGELFFRHNQTAELVNWRGPWWCLCLLTAGNLVISPLSALLEGCDQVNWTARARIFQNLGRSTVLIGGLFLGLGLYAPAAATLCALLVYLFQFKTKWVSLLTQILTCPIEEKISWSKEILPMQWRIAVSWASGYFIFSLFNPLLFSYAGAKVAGKFGMTWAILSAISGVCQTCVNTRGPRFAVHTARKEWGGLRRLWMTSLIQASSILIVGVATFILCVKVLSYSGGNLANRVVGIDIIVLFGFAMLANQFVFAVAVLARAEKKEPFLWVSLITAVVVAAGSYIVVPIWGVLGLSIVYLTASIIALMMTLPVYRKIAMVQSTVNT
jgi:O-antigen/teichoic acid export membrane protein